MTSSSRPPRIAIVHEWLTGMRGGEKCVEALCEVYPGAHLFTLLHNPGSVSPVIERMPIHTSFIQHLPFASRRYRHYLLLFPAAIERLDLDGFDIVISSNHCVAKGVRTPPSSLHICYCHTPMRYIWGLYDQYFGPGRAGLPTRMAMGAAVGWLRRWDVRTAAHPHWFVANSENVRRRIRDLYARDADVIYPPVDAADMSISRRDEGYFLMVTALVPYKRIDLAVAAFTRMRERLVIVGGGPEKERLLRTAGPCVEFRGWLSDREVRDLYAGCSGVILPGEEDFGIVPLEAMACGKPVVAFAKGGALETVLEGPELITGVLFREQSADSLSSAVKQCRSAVFDPEAIRRFALSFDRARFKSSMAEYVQRRWIGHRSPQLQGTKEVIGNLR